jgi:hypothetical protein
MQQHAQSLTSLLRIFCAPSRDLDLICDAALLVMYTLSVMVVLSNNQDAPVTVGAVCTTL